MPGEKKRLVEQMILACPTCGVPSGNCDPEPCRDGIVPMTKGRAADLAVIYAFKRLATEDLTQ